MVLTRSFFSPPKCWMSIRRKAKNLLIFVLFLVEKCVLTLQKGFLSKRQKKYSQEASLLSCCGFYRAVQILNILLIITSISGMTGPGKDIIKKRWRVKGRCLI